MGFGVRDYRIPDPKSPTPFPDSLNAPQMNYNRVVNFAEETNYAST